MSEANAAERVAIQIRILREKAGLSQSQLAKKLGTRQSAIARLEDPSYGKQSLAVLHKVAAVFDVALWVEFSSFADVLQKTANLSPATITPKSYVEEFAEDGEPLQAVPLAFDGSVICRSNYVTRIGQTTLQVFGVPNANTALTSMDQANTSFFWNAVSFFKER